MLTHNEIMKRLLYAENNDDPLSGERLRKIQWIREHTFTLCPHCNRYSKTCFTEMNVGKQLGLARCRHENCQQAFSLYETITKDTMGAIVDENYQIPTY